MDERNQPVCFANVVRETHESELSSGNQTKVYFGCMVIQWAWTKILQTKVQAEPGEALKWKAII